MTLDEALAVLVRVHTREDREAGFTVEAYPHMIMASQREYIDAWETVVRHVHPAQFSHMDARTTAENTPDAKS